MKKQVDISKMRKSISQFYGNVSHYYGLKYQADVEASERFARENAKDLGILNWETTSLEDLIDQVNLKMIDLKGLNV